MPPSFPAALGLSLLPQSQFLFPLKSCRAQRVQHSHSRNKSKINNNNNPIKDLPAVQGDNLSLTMALMFLSPWSTQDEAEIREWQGGHSPEPSPRADVQERQSRFQLAFLIYPSSWSTTAQAQLVLLAAIICRAIIKLFFL